MVRTFFFFETKTTPRGEVGVSGRWRGRLVEVGKVALGNTVSTVGKKKDMIIGRG